MDSLSSMIDDVTSDILYLVPTSETNQLFIRLVNESITWLYPLTKAVHDNLTFFLIAANLLSAFWTPLNLAHLNQLINYSINQLIVCPSLLSARPPTYWWLMYCTLYLFSILDILNAL